MISVINYLLRISKTVQLCNDNGYVIYIVAIATGNMGVYTNTGEYYSSCRLSVEHYHFTK